MTHLYLVNYNIYRRKVNIFHIDHRLAHFQNNFRKYDQ